MSKVSNDDLIRAIFTAPDESKARALAILEGKEISAPDTGPLLLTMGQTAELLGVSRATLWRAIRAGRIEKVEIYSGAFRLRRADILALVGSRPSHRRSMHQSPRSASEASRGLTMLHRTSRSRPQRGCGGGRCPVVAVRV